jgi:mRNA-degrading endonuclease RelE of RelBE toxin-antitoxin system
MARVFLTSEARQQLQELPEVIEARVRDIFVRLEKWPAVSGARPLRGTLAGRYRVRTGDYRVQFYVRGEDVIVEKVGNRDRFYEE